MKQTVCFPFYCTDTKFLILSLYNFVFQGAIEQVQLLQGANGYLQMCPYADTGMINSITSSHTVKDNKCSVIKQIPVKLVKVQ